MNRTIRFRIPRPSPALALAMIALLVALTGSATAAGLLVTSKQIKDGTIQVVDISKKAQDALGRAEAQGNTIEGAWRVTVTRTEPGAPPPFAAFVTFGAGGSAVEVNPLNQSAAVGAWAKLSDHQYRWRITRYRFNAAGMAVATATPVETDTLSQSGDEFDGTSTVEIRDLNGNVIATGAATTHGVRIRP